MRKLGVFAVLMMALLGTSFASEALGQQSSRNDFREHCQAFQGRWVGEVTLVADIPGVGKRGEKVTAYSEIRVAEDGNALIGKWYGGNGSATFLAVYDAGAKQIKAMEVTTEGEVGHIIFYKKDKKWIEERTGSKSNGTPTKYTNTVTITDNGNTHTWTGSGTVDVFRRVSK
jgi:hypothetical protein